jgi:hypothetical protein
MDEANIVRRISVMRAQQEAVLTQDIQQAAEALLWLRVGRIAASELKDQEGLGNKAIARRLEEIREKGEIWRYLDGGPEILVALGKLMSLNPPPSPGTRKRERREVMRLVKILLTRPVAERQALSSWNKTADFPLNKEVELYSRYYLWLTRKETLARDRANARLDRESAEQRLDELRRQSLREVARAKWGDRFVRRLQRESELAAKEAKLDKKIAELEKELRSFPGLQRDEARILRRMGAIRAQRKVFPSRAFRETAEALLWLRVGRIVAYELRDQEGLGEKEVARRLNEFREKGEKWRYLDGGSEILVALGKLMSLSPPPSPGTRKRERREVLRLVKILLALPDSERRAVSPWNKTADLPLSEEDDLYSRYYTWLNWRATLVRKLANARLNRERAEQKVDVKARESLRTIAAEPPPRGLRKWRDEMRREWRKLRSLCRFDGI